MKKIIIEILLGLTLPATVFHTQLTDIFQAEKPVNKEISFSITRDSNYNQQVYGTAMASVRVVIFKVRDNKQTILWNKVYESMPLKNYPVSGKNLYETVIVHNISDRREKLFVTYMVTYNAKGSVMEVENGTTLSKGVKQDKLEINI